MIGNALRQRRSGLGRLRPHLSARANRERQQLGRVSPSCGNIEHLHAGLHLRERQELRGFASLIHAPVLVRPDFARDHGFVASDIRIRRRCRATGHHAEQGDHACETDEGSTPMSDHSLLPWNVKGGSVADDEALSGPRHRCAHRRVDIAFRTHISTGIDAAPFATRTCSSWIVTCNRIDRSAIRASARVASTGTSLTASLVVPLQFFSCALPPQVGCTPAVRDDVDR